MHSSAIDQALLPARTAGHLRASQIAHRLRFRIQRGMQSRLPVIAVLWLCPREQCHGSWPNAFQPAPRGAILSTDVAAFDIGAELVFAQRSFREGVRAEAAMLA